MIKCYYRRKPELNQLYLYPIALSVLNCSSWSFSKDHLLLIQCYYNRKPKLNQSYLYRIYNSKTISSMLIPYLFPHFQYISFVLTSPRSEAPQTTQDIWLFCFETLCAHMCQAWMKFPKSFFYLWGAVNFQVISTYYTVFTS